MDNLRHVSLRRVIQAREVLFGLGGSSFLGFVDSQVPALQCNRKSKCRVQPTFLLTGRCHAPWICRKACVICLAGLHAHVTSGYLTSITSVEQVISLSTLPLFNKQVWCQRRQRRWWGGIDWTDNGPWLLSVEIGWKSDRPLSIGTVVCELKQLSTHHSVIRLQREHTDHWSSVWLLTIKQVDRKEMMTQIDLWSFRMNGPHLPAS